MASPAAFGLVLLLVSSSVATGPPPPATGPAEAVRKVVRGFPGQVRLFAKNLDTGASVGLGEDELVRTASTIKLPVMVEAFDRVARGAARWDEPLTVTHAEGHGRGRQPGGARPGQQALRPRGLDLPGDGRPSGEDRRGRGRLERGLDRLRADVAIVYSDRGRLAMAITVDDMPEIVWNVENPGLLMLSRLSLALVDGLGASR
jgi:hypothetical protein